MNELVDMFRNDGVAFLTDERHVFLKAIIKKSGLMNMSVLRGLFLNDADILIMEE
ncbi:hypothetical protein [Klebsiella pneumoniae IS46]|nr:hypothetical protein CSC13_2501 [Klebsiella pneumoniae]MWP45313.1 hypothetical protein [Klebsiella pneumoniae]CDL18159.1 hypothetical protein [Klebsiella pneumoniae IS46]HBW2961913.1 hypothetical protein [Klebsiella pneumoniae]